MAIIPLLISLFSLIVSIVGVLINRRNNKYTTYTKLNEMLIGEKAASGRRKLFRAYQKETELDQEHQDWDDINYSLALLDTLGVYARKGLVDRDLALKAWYYPLLNIYEPAHWFISRRKLLGIYQPWLGLRWILEEVMNLDSSDIQKWWEND